MKRTQEANTMQSEALAKKAADAVGVTPYSNMRPFVEQAVKWALNEAALSTDAEPYAEPVKTAPAVAVKAGQLAHALADELERMGQPRPNGDILHDALSRVLPALSAQVQDVAGWQSMDSAPKDGSEFVAGRRYAPDGEFVVHTYKWVGEPNYWSSKRNGVCIRPQYQDDFVWCPLPASPASRHGDAE